MKRLAILLLAFAFAVVACGGGDDPTLTLEPPTDAPSTRLEIDPAELDDGLLTTAEVGEGWQRDDDAVPSTVQIGGQVGPANLDSAEADETSAFEQTDGSGYITNNLFLLQNGDTAHEWIELHRRADGTKTWEQDREDGGTASNKNNGPITDLPALGDEMYTAKIAVTITDGDGVTTERRVHYVVYRIDRLLAFVIAQDADAAEYARKQEARVARLAA
ncbi:MAG: hypothetical protein WD826_09775 [Actinomycetota bacterium]